MINLTEEQKTELLIDAIGDLSEAIQCTRVGDCQDYAMAAHSKLMRIMTAIQSQGETIQ